MNVTNQEASYIASYLGKGAFIDKYRDIKIAIGEKAEIGISKRGRKYALYIKYDNKYDRTATIPKFTDKISVDELASFVKAAIEKSIPLEDIDLDMRKIPRIMNPLTNPGLSNDEYFKDESDILDLDLEEFVQDSADTDTDVAYETAEIEDNIPLNEQELDECTPDDIDDFEKMFNASDNNDSSESENIEKEDLEEIESALEDFDDEPDNYPYGEDGAVAVDIDETVDESFHKKYAEDELLYEEEDAAEMSDEKESLDLSDIDIILSQKNMLAERKENSLSETSYLYQMIGTEEEIKEKMHNIFNQLVDMDLEVVTEFYIRALYDLVALYENDIEKMSSDINIDKRDILLALYERRLIN